MTTAIVFDTETTGITLPSVSDLSSQPRIIELGAVKVVDGKRVAELSQKLNPEIPLEEVITKITGLTDADLADQPNFKDFLPQARAFFADVDVLVAHNAPFDEAMLLNELRRVDALGDFPMPPLVLCSLQEYWHLFGRPMKLLELYEHVLGKPLAQTHRALDDVNALLEILDAADFWSSL